MWTVKPVVFSLKIVERRRIEEPHPGSMPVLKMVNKALPFAPIVGVQRKRHHPATLNTPKLVMLRMSVPNHWLANGY